MKANMSFYDRILRLILAVTIIALYLRNTITGSVGIILVVVAIVIAVSASVNYCPLYALLGIRKWENKA
ncbi:MAG TPA: DUF2892 domain-containing protein [Cyclobacteriaceae bacterium]|nr:DUF2892 domain-containing protein [Cyclobacteriaceae bacterium]